jgi:uncharacterized membrane protein YfcA
MDGNTVALGWQLLVGLGCLSGLASGLLGIGGGMIVVPALVLLLPLIGIDGPELPKVAMATSLTLVIPTAIAGTQAHAARGSIDWRLWAVMAPALVAGSLLAMIIVRGISVSLITMIFVGFALLSALRLVRRKAPAPLPLDAAGPNVPVLLAKSLGGGTLATLLGFGVAFFAVPVLSRLIPMPRAIGTASALALPMAIGGSIGYLHAVAPAGCAGCTGYVYLPAVAAIGVATVLTVPLGARLTSVLPTALVRWLFALLLVAGAASLTAKKRPDMLAEAELLLTRTPLRLAAAPAARPAWLVPSSTGGDGVERPGLRHSMVGEGMADRLPNPVAAHLIAARLPAWLAPVRPSRLVDSVAPVPVRRPPARFLGRVSAKALPPAQAGTVYSTRPRAALRLREEAPTEIPAAGLLQTLFGR